MKEPLAVDVRRLTRHFGSVTAVDDMSFSVEPGQVLALLGHNGAGKTTLIRLFTGLLRPDEGSIATLGMDPVRDGQKVRARTGVLTEYPALDHFLTPAENLAVHADVHGLDHGTAARRIRELLGQLGLDEHRDLPAHSLSAGLKQRVALARALVHNPDLLLLDEPTSNLDPLGARTVRSIVRRLVREEGRTVVLSTHNLAEAQELADRVAVIRQGRLLAFGSLEELTGAMTTARVMLTLGTGDVPVALSALRTRGLAVDAQVADHNTLSVRAAPDDVPNVVRLLVAADVAVQAVRPERPTLEEVYVSLHGTPSAVSADTAGR